MQLWVRHFPFTSVFMQRCINKHMTHAHTHVWITSNVLTHPRAKHFSPITHTSEDPHQILVQPSFAPCQNITARKRASNPRETKKKENVIPFRLGQNFFQEKICPSLHFRCDERCGGVSGIPLLAPRCRPSKRLNVYCDHICRSSVAICTHCRIGFIMHSH